MTPEAGQGIARALALLHVLLEGGFLLAGGLAEQGL
jgi:hypothetical protein